MTYLCKKKFFLTSELKPLNQLVFNTIYVPILEENGVFLYTQFLHKSEVLIITKSNQSQDLKNFLESINWNFEKFELERRKLEMVGLLKTSLVVKPENLELYFFEIFKPETFEEVLHNHSLIQLLTNKIGLKAQERIDFIKILINNNQQIHLHAQSLNALDISATPSREQDKKIDEIVCLLSEELKTQFYATIYETFKQSFVVPIQVYNLVYHCCVEEKALLIDDLSILGYKSLIKDHEGFKICTKRFMEQIQFITCKRQSFEKELYHDFWKKMLSINFKEFKKYYFGLFDKINPENTYKLFVKKQQLPKALIKWMNECYENGFQSGIINLMMSFTFTWCKRIPISYLSQLANSVINFENNLEETFEHFQSVIQNDVESGKNRLKISLIEEIQLPVCKPALPSVEKIQDSVNQNSELDDVNQEIMGYLKLK